MSELIPDNANRLAYWLGILFHPASVMFVTLWLLLDDLPLSESLTWMSLIAAIILIPGFTTIALLKRKERYTYQRSSRLPLYLVAWFSVLAALALLWLQEGPRILLISLTTLAFWLPVQLGINHFFTKISTHLAVISGCFAALLFLGELTGIVWLSLGIAAILITAWARLKTKNHTLVQVLLGILVGAGMVLLVFPFFLR
jgi:membrane-associated phospholipid phosphatase